MENSHGISIRALLATDREQWGVLWQGYLEFYQQPLAAEITEYTFHRLTGSGPHRALVAVADDRLVGLVHFLFHDRTWSLQPTCYLEDLFVCPDRRGSGVGRALIEAVYAEADQRGSRHVYWQTQNGNATARRLYDRVGRLSEFVRYDRPGID